MYQVVAFQHVSSYFLGPIMVILFFVPVERRSASGYLVLHGYHGENPPLFTDVPIQSSILFLDFSIFSHGGGDVPARSKAQRVWRKGEPVAWRCCPNHLPDPTCNGQSVNRSTLQVPAWNVDIWWHLMNLMCLEDHFRYLNHLKNLKFYTFSMWCGSEDVLFHTVKHGWVFRTPPSLPRAHWPSAFIASDVKTGSLVAVQSSVSHSKGSLKS